MGLQLENLDARTRRLMLDELEQDVACGRLYISPRLSERGQEDYYGLLRDAIINGNDVSLTEKLGLCERMKISKPKYKRKGGSINARLPNIAPVTLAEGEFNRYYIRGLCCRALEDGIRQLEVYRAKPVRDPRIRSEAMIGKRIDAKALLEDLRTHQGVNTEYGVPGGPNSAISVRLSEPTS